MPYVNRHRVLRFPKPWAKTKSSSSFPLKSLPDGQNSFWQKSGYELALQMEQLHRNRTSSHGSFNKWSLETHAELLCEDVEVTGISNATEVSLDSSRPADALDVGLLEINDCTDSTATSRSKLDYSSNNNARTLSNGAAKMKFNVEINHEMGEQTDQPLPNEMAICAEDSNKLHFLGSRIGTEPPTSWLIATKNRNDGVDAEQDAAQQCLNEKVEKLAISNEDSGNLQTTHEALPSENVRKSKTNVGARHDMGDDGEITENGVNLDKEKPLLRVYNRCYTTEMTSPQFVISSEAAIPEFGDNNLTPGGLHRLIQHSSKTKFNFQDEFRAFSPVNLVQLDSTSLKTEENLCQTGGDKLQPELKIVESGTNSQFDALHLGRVVCQEILLNSLQTPKLVDLAVSKLVIEDTLVELSNEAAAVGRSHDIAYIQSLKDFGRSVSEGKLKGITPQTSNRMINVASTMQHSQSDNLSLLSPLPPLFYALGAVPFGTDANQLLDCSISEKTSGDDRDSLRKSRARGRVSLQRIRIRDLNPSPKARNHVSDDNEIYSNTKLQSLGRNSTLSMPTCVAGRNCVNQLQSTRCEWLASQRANSFESAHSVSSLSTMPGTTASQPGTGDSNRRLRQLPQLGLATPRRIQQKGRIVMNA